jgi:hypothetical protein
MTRPAWVASPPVREVWTCPAPDCGRSVWRDNPASKGIWFAPTETELVARCAAQHAVHDRHGDPLVADEPWSGGAAGEGDEDVAGFVRLAGGTLIVLCAPPLLLLPDGDRVEVRELGEVTPSDLVGSPLTERGRAIGVVDATALDLDERLGTLALAPLRAALALA